MIDDYNENEIWCFKIMIQGSKRRTRGKWREREREREKGARNKAFGEGRER